MTKIFKTEDKFCIYVCGCACKTIHDKIWFWQVPRINRSVRHIIYNSGDLILGHCNTKCLVSIYNHLRAFSLWM